MMIGIVEFTRSPASHTAAAAAEAGEAGTQGVARQIIREVQPSLKEGISPPPCRPPPPRPPLPTKKHHNRRRCHGGN